jgi:hypothetical protein
VFFNPIPAIHTEMVGAGTLTEVVGAPNGDLTNLFTRTQFKRHHPDSVLLESCLLDGTAMISLFSTGKHLKKSVLRKRSTMLSLSTPWKPRLRASLSMSHVQR